MMNKYKYLIKNIGILTISNFSSKILVFLLVPLYTSILSTREYGTYDLIVSTIQLVIPVLTGNIADAVMRFSMDKSINNVDVLTIGIKHISHSFLVIALFLVGNRLGNWFPEIKKYEILIFMYYVALVLNQYSIQLMKGLEKVKDMAISGVMGTLSMLLFNILFLIVLKWGINGFFLANIISLLLPVIYCFSRLNMMQYIKRTCKNKELEREMLIYSVPLILTVIGWWINSTSDRYVVSVICGMEANGLLSVSYKIPAILNIIQGIVIQAWQISAIKEKNEKEKSKFYNTVFIYLNILMCFACTILIFLTRPIAYVLYSKDFFEAWRYVPFLLISSVLNASSGFVGSILAANKNSKDMAKSALFGASANVLMNIVFVLLIGVQGATVATVISSYIIYIVRKRAIGNLMDSSQHWRVVISWGLLCLQAVIEIDGRFYIAEFIILAVLCKLYWEKLKYIIFHISEGVL